MVGVGLGLNQFCFTSPTTPATVIQGAVEEFVPNLKRRPMGSVRGQKCVAMLWLMSATSGAMVVEVSSFKQRDVQRGKETRAGRLPPGAQQIALPKRGPALSRDRDLAVIHIAGWNVAGNSRALDSRQAGDSLQHALLECVDAVPTGAA